MRAALQIARIDRVTSFIWFRVFRLSLIGDFPSFSLTIIRSSHTRSFLRTWQTYLE